MSSIGDIATLTSAPLLGILVAVAFVAPSFVAVAVEDTVVVAAIVAAVANVIVVVVQDSAAAVVEVGRGDYFLSLSTRKRV